MNSKTFRNINDRIIQHKPRTQRNPSREQMALEYALTDVCPDMEVLENYSDPSWGFPDRMDVDIFIPDENIAIEYDSLKYHQDKIKLEQYKNDILTRNGVPIIRVREAGLPRVLGSTRTYWYNGLDDYSKSRAMDHAIKYIAESHREGHRIKMDKSSRFLSRFIERYRMSRVKIPEIELEKNLTRASWGVANTDAMTKGDIIRIRKDAGYDYMSRKQKKLFRIMYEQAYWNEKRKDHRD